MQFALRFFLEFILELSCSAVCCNLGNLMFRILVESPLPSPAHSDKLVGSACSMAMTREEPPPECNEEARETLVVARIRILIDPAGCRARVQKNSRESEAGSSSDESRIQL